jgi:16S rRNA (cytidine1402-2'-O)-methyltransferase
MLSVVSTPIGNLGDITLRAIETLKSCQAIACEDTRVTGQLLKHLGLEKKELISLHGYSDPRRTEAVVARLLQGEHIALVSDAGTPGISDPGFVLVSKAREAGVRIEGVPGAAAFLTALSVSGLPIHHFLYLGFLPLKKGRQTLLKTFIEEERTIVFYESVHRIQRTLHELAELLSSQPERPVVIARELTKLHEETIQTTVAELPNVADRVTQKGEFVIILGPAYVGHRSSHSPHRPADPSGRDADADSDVEPGEGA